MALLRNMIIGGLIAFAAASAPAHAGVYTVDVYTGDLGRAFDAVASSAKLFTPAAHSQHARFTYTGDLDFTNTALQNASTTGDLNSVFFGDRAAGISDYRAVTVVANADYGSFATLSSFLAASGSVAGYAYGSFYMFTDASTTTNGMKLTLRHDDGVGVYSSGVLIPGTTTGPTSAITETVTIPAGTGYSIAYTRENGTPSVLTVAVPEPMSVSLLGAGLLGLALARRRRA